MTGVQKDGFLVDIDKRCPSKCNYRYGLATGSWTEVARVDGKNLEAPHPFSCGLGATARAQGFGHGPSLAPGRVVASGSWGSLWIQEYSGNVSITSGLGPPRFLFLSPPSEPEKFAYRVRLFDQAGKEFPAFGLTPWQGTYGWTLNVPENPAIITVETRPYEWIDFRGIPLEPDHRDWERSHHGSEGEDAVVRDPASGLQLRAFVRNAPHGGGCWVYAPDGKQWIDFPQKAWLHAEYPIRKGLTEAIFAMYPTVNHADRMPTVDIFESTSLTPGQGLGRLTASYKAYVAGEDAVTPMLFEMRKRARYVQFRVTIGAGPWKTFETVLLPTDQGLASTPTRLESGGGSDSAPRFSLVIRKNGEIYTAVPTAKGDLPHTELKTHPEERGPVRVMALMKDGTERQLITNPHQVDGYNEYDFDQTSDNQVVFEGDRKVRLSDIASFEIQDQEARPPIYLAGRLPSN